MLPARQDEICRPEGETENLMKSVAAGVNPAAVKAAINERVAHIDRLRALGSVDLPQKITS